MDAAGLIVGLPGLVVACADLYKLTVTHRHRARDVNVVINQVAIEQWRFAYWLRDVGFIEGSRPMLKLPPAVQQMLLHQLQTIEATLAEMGALLEKYEDTSVKSDPAASGQNLDLPENLFRLRIKDAARSRLPKPVKKAVDAAVKPMTWAAGESERATKLVEDLKSLNEGLNFISEKLNNTKVSLLPSRLLPYISDQNNLQAVIEATTQHDPELARCAEIKKEVLAAIGRKPGSVVKPSTLKLLAPKVSKRRKLATTRLVLAEYNDKATGKVEPVLLEDRTYGDGPPEYEKFVDSRIQEVAAILSKSPKPARMKVLDCAGYVQNRVDKSFSFVFRFPGGALPDVAPISLQKLLPLGQGGWSERRKKMQQDESITEKPTLSTRFAMAETLSQSVALLLACGVLHKGIAPGNIVFFQTEGAADNVPTKYDLTRPFLTGFSWARLHGKKYISDTVASADFASTSGLLHAHPAYSYTPEQRYLKVFDVYSLGLVLLQIGLWRSLPDLADQLFPSPKSLLNQAGRTLDDLAGGADNYQWLQQKIVDWQAQIQLQQQLVSQSDGIAAIKDPREAFRAALVQKVEHLLSAEVGETYTRVVARCLTGDLDNDGMPHTIVTSSSDEQDPDDVLQDAFLKGVLEQLEKCNA